MSDMSDTSTGILQFLQFAIVISEQNPLPNTGSLTMASISEKDYATIAARHGVDLADVNPLPKQERIAQLKAALSRTDVAFPISPERAAKYLAAYEAGEDFGIGSLGDNMVDLGKYANFQIYDDYTFEEHLSWACLVADQQKTKHRFACREYLEGERLFEIGGSVIPDFYLLNARIYQQTQWQLATVNMLIPAELFFTCHSSRFFPVTTFMRQLEQDYLQEPDIGHDVAGHVATFTIPAVAQVMVVHGRARDLIYAERDEKISAAGADPAAIRQIQAWADELLLYAGRIYWFTVEFGLVMQDGEVRDFGAGILSSPGETSYSINNPGSNRILIDPSCDHDLLRLATTDYLISEYQKTYFVMKSFCLLESLTPERIVDTAKKAMQLPHYTWREIAPGDDTLNVGSDMTSPNEKYFRLMTHVPLDTCLTRAAIRNLRMYTRGFDLDLLKHFKAAPPKIPSEVIAWFQKEDIGDRFRIETEEPEDA
jgi:phenylalanine-4-hydroxylase